ncbi:hypothetical protein EGW08_001843, partial [Elysia chlorotica]
MFRFLGSRKNEIQEERANPTKVLNERPRNRVQESSSSVQGTLQRSALVQQQQQHNSENMVTLHARLLQEAEKIRKWKVQTELDLKEKERRMGEALSRIETMKKSILELQLQNEKTSAKLEEEITNKGEVLKRIDATREMCHLLKSHASSVIERLSRCETEKTELKYSNKEQTKQFQELTEKFMTLKIQVVENTKNSKHHADKEKLVQMQREENLKTKLLASETQMQNLKDALNKKNEEIENLENLLQARMLKVESLELATNELQKNVSCLSKELETRETELKDSALRIASIQDEKGSLEKNLQTLEIDFGDLQASKDNLALKLTENLTTLEGQVKAVQENYRKAEMELEEKRKKLSICEHELHEANSALESLRTEKDALIMEKKDAEINEGMLRFQISNLLTEKEENKRELETLNGEISVLSKKLDRESVCRAQVQDECEALQEKIASFELLKKEKESQISSLQVELGDWQTKAESLETVLSRKDSELVELQAKTETLEQTIKSESKRVHELKAEIKESEIALAEKTEALNQCELSLHSAVETLKVSEKEKEILEQNLTASEAQIAELRTTSENQDKKIEELTNQLENVNEQQKESGKSLTVQQKKCTTTAKLNRELEKEVKALKSKLQKEAKTLQQQADELMAVHTEMAQMKEAKANSDIAIQNYKEEMTHLKLQCESDQKKAQLAMEKAKEMQLSAEKEKENAQALTDCQLTEMMSTLETYKQNNEKLISEKDFTIEELKRLIDNHKTAAMKHAEEKLDWSRENDALKKEMSSLEIEKEKLTVQVTALLSTKDELKKELLALENQMSVCKIQAVHKMQEVHTPLQRNAAPVVEVTPQKQQAPRTPQPSTPKVSTVPKTPSRSILRMVNSESKRRKVAFAACDSPDVSSDECDLMELDPEASFCTNSRTPLLFTPSPKQDDSFTAGSKPVPSSQKPQGPQTLLPEACGTTSLFPLKGNKNPIRESKPLPLNRKPRGRNVETKSS